MSTTRARQALITLLAAVSVSGLGNAPLAGEPVPQAPAGWWVPDSNRVFPERSNYPDATGIITVLHVGGPVNTRGNPFFTSIGKNGRACVTCHQPTDGMSVSVKSVAERWTATHGKDPIFAAIDGSNCPSLPQEATSSHSLLLTRGLFRIPRPWPRAPDGHPITPQFTIQVMHDPTGCNLDPIYGLKSAHPTVSVFRRPRPAANLKYVTAYGFVFDPKTGLPLAIDPQTGLRYAGNLMADGRVRTLREQALDALRTHLQRYAPVSATQMREIIDFESHLYVAQSYDFAGGSLTADGAQGGPDALAAAKPGVLDGPYDAQWAEFAAWSKDGHNPHLTAAERAFRASVVRGIDFFRSHTFLITDSAGLNSMNFGNPTRNSCSFCHNMTRTGMDVAPGQVDLGTANLPFADPAPDLPLFKLTCKPQYPPHPFLGRVVYTHDPGYALTTGKCEDIGKITIQDMRGIAARPPYFSNGSARTLRDIVNFYDRRYHIGLTERQKADLTNLLRVL